MIVFAHLVQVIHLIVLLFVVYYSCVNIYVPFVFVILVYMGFLIFGACPFTLFSDIFFTLAGEEGYLSLSAWLASIVGSPMNDFLLACAIIGVFLFSLIKREKKEIEEHKKKYTIFLR